MDGLFPIVGESCIMIALTVRPSASKNATPLGYLDAERPLWGSYAERRNQQTCLYSLCALALELANFFVHFLDHIFHGGFGFNFTAPIAFQPRPDLRLDNRVIFACFHGLQYAIGHG